MEAGSMRMITTPLENTLTFPSFLSSWTHLSRSAWVTSRMLAKSHLFPVKAKMMLGLGLACFCNSTTHFRIVSKELCWGAMIWVHALIKKVNSPFWLYHKQGLLLLHHDNTLVPMIDISLVLHIKS
jgi:hypothetical protein